MVFYEVISEKLSSDGRSLTAEIRTPDGAVCIMNIPQGRTHTEEMSAWGDDFVRACFRTLYPDTDFSGLNLTVTAD